MLRTDSVRSVSNAGGRNIKLCNAPCINTRTRIVLLHKKTKKTVKILGIKKELHSETLLRLENLTQIRRSGSSKGEIYLKTM